MRVCLNPQPFELSIIMDGSPARNAARLADICEKRVRIDARHRL